MRTTKPKKTRSRSRKPQLSKRVANLIAGPARRVEGGFRTREELVAEAAEAETQRIGSQRALAIVAAIRFLMGAIAQERIALARRPERVPPGLHHTETRMADELAEIPTIDTMRLALAVDDVGRSADLEEELDRGVARLAAAFTRSLPKEFLEARRAEDFLRAHNAATGMVSSPEIEGLKASWAARHRSPTKKDKQRDILAVLSRDADRRAQALKATEKLHALLERAHLLDDEGQSRLREQLAEKQAEIKQIDPRAPLFSSETKVREHIGNEMRLSRNTIIELARRAGRVAKEPK